MFSNSKKVNIVVVTFNRCALLEECLNALLAQDYDNYSVYLINNASTDNTEEMIKEKFCDERIKYYNTGENLGGAGGFNYGVRRAATDPCDYIWLMDDDTIVRNNSLRKLVDYAAKHNDDFGFLSSYVEFTDGTPCQMNIPTLLGDENYKKRTWLNHTDVKAIKEDVRIIHGTFVSFFVRRDVVLELGLPIKDFFIWSDDTEYSIRISNVYKCYFCPESVVLHKMAANGAATIRDFINCSPDRVARYFYKYRNQFYVKKQKGFKKALRFSCRVVKDSLRILFEAKEGKAAKIKVLYKGFFSGLVFSPDIEYISADKSK